MRLWIALVAVQTLQHISLVELAAVLESTKKDKLDVTIDKIWYRYYMISRYRVMNIVSKRGSGEVCVWCKKSDSMNIQMRWNNSNSSTTIFFLLLYKMMLQRQVILILSGWGKCSE